MKKYRLKKGIGIGLTALFIALIFVVNTLCYQYNTVITRWWSGTFTKTDVESLGYTADEARENGFKLTQDIEAEGAVLLKNKGILPMKPQNISLIGYGSFDPMYIGAGSVAQSQDSSGSKFIDYYTAFENDGFACNQDMKNYYSTQKDTRDNNAGGMFDMRGSDFNIYDQPLNKYQDVMDKAGDFSDTAVVVISRTGGEGSDEPLNMGKYDNGDEGKHYLELQEVEIDMLNYCKNNYENIIVIINSSNAMELGFLEDEKIDAAIWIGGPGSAGIQAVADIICGKVNPSGKLADTYAYDLTSAPSYYTCTAGTYANYEKFDDSKNGYDNKVDGGVTWYNEGIYVGYRYYETAAAEGYINYANTVQYPFGYGLSYTTFDWEITDQKFEGVHGEISVDVKVTNTGDVAGKDVVQLYFTAPYYEGGIEKSEKELGAFGKTSELAPGESETVTLKMNVDDIASYDYTGKRCYVADEGTYKFNLQTDSHNTKEGCDTIEYSVNEKWVYNNDGVGKRSSDEIVSENQFDKVSNGDGNINNTIPYVSRSDFEGTMPQATMGKHITELIIEMGDEVIQYILNSEGGSDVSYDNDDKYETESLIKVETNQDNGLTVEDLAGYEEWNDEVWDKLVNQMSVDDMVKLLSDCAYGTPAIDSIGKKLATDVDGPAGVSSANLNYYGNEYTAEVVMASTWNTSLIRNVGVSVGRECKAAGISGWYAPGANMHRSPFNGRNGEYYSEDPLLSGKIAAAEIQGVNSEDIYVYVKHFAGNDQDSKRGGMYTWMNEQALREIYLEPFEYAVKEGEASGVMESYNRIGTMETSTCYALNTKVLRNEWGFKGVCLTDGYNPMFGSEKYNSPDLQIRANGSSMILFTGGYNGTGTFTEKTTGSQEGIEMLHDACKRLLYVHCNSSAMEISRDYTPYWIGILVVVNILLIAGGTLSSIFMVYKPIKRKKEEKAKVSIESKAE